MPSDDKEQKKRRRPIIGAFGRMFTLRRSDLRVNEEFGKLRSGLQQTKHLCPQDQNPMILDDVFPTDNSGQIPTGSEAEQALVCPVCNFTVPVSALKERLKQQAAPFKKSERMFFFFGAALFCILCIISILNKNIYTLLGGLLFALMLFMNAGFYRYRHWQISNMRLFEPKSPVFEFFREELFKNKSPDDS